jgi:hypothetical protein
MLPASVGAAPGSAVGTAPNVWPSWPGAGVTETPAALALLGGIAGAAAGSGEAAE